MGPIEKTVKYANDPLSFITLSSTKPLKLAFSICQMPFPVIFDFAHILS
jgi:hypothetical protein